MSSLPFGYFTADWVILLLRYLVIRIISCWIIRCISVVYYRPIAAGIFNQAAIVFYRLSTIDYQWLNQEGGKERERKKEALSLYRTLAYRQHAIRVWLVQSSLEHPHCAPRLYIDVSPWLAIVLEQCFCLAVGCFDLSFARLSGGRDNFAFFKEKKKHRRLKLIIDFHLFGM